MSAGSITLSGAITVLVAEKRAVGYKYDAEARVLTRFEAGRIYVVLPALPPGFRRAGCVGSAAWVPA